MATSALTAALVTGYPTLVALLVGTRDAGALGALFAALTLSRVPLLLVSPIQAVTVPAVVGWRAGDGSGARTARRVLVGGTLAAVGVGLVAAAAGWWIGPWLVAFVYTASYDVPGAGVALLLLAACLLAWLLLLSAALIALAAHRRVVVVWAGAVAATVLWLLVSPLNPLMTTAVGTVVGPCVGLVLALPHLWSHLAPARPVPTAAR
jgi:O-antigen/teichoic acid export membrane protein